MALDFKESVFAESITGFISVAESCLTESFLMEAFTILVVGAGSRPFPKDFFPKIISGWVIPK